MISVSKSVSGTGLSVETEEVVVFVIEPEVFVIELDKEEVSADRLVELVLFPLFSDIVMRCRADISW